MTSPAQTNAFVLRIAPGGDDMVQQSLNNNEIVIGWRDAQGLTNPALTWPEFRSIVSDAYYADEKTLRRAGGAAGQLWRFIRDMKPGDLVVVPHPGVFYVAQVSGDATHGNGEHTLYRRPVKWLNDKQPIPRKIARAALQSRMKIQGTCADAGDLYRDIVECLDLPTNAAAPSFHQDLHTRLINETISEIRAGRMDSYGFESLIQDAMLGLGATKCTITPRQVDFGADLVATFLLAGVFELRVAIQAKHHYDVNRPLQASVVAEVIRSIEEEGASLGMIITAGRISDEATAAAQAYFEKAGIKIELVDGEQFAGLIVERGLGVYRSHRVSEA
jgi:predicted Mrr-cat superfamily restriction endonuclease